MTVMTSRRTSSIAWSYVVWGAIALFVAIPELGSAGWHTPWRTISQTTGHLEHQHDWIAVVVVTLVVFAAVHNAATTAGRGCGLFNRTPGGRTTRRDPSQLVARRTDPWFFGYLAVATGLVAGGPLVAAAAGADQWVLGYVIYGSIALFFGAVPSLLAYFAARDVPFRTVFRTLAELERHGRAGHFLMLVVSAGLVVLLVHLAFYPWPNVFG
jgi:hypothetical protein